MSPPPRLQLTTESTIRYRGEGTPQPFSQQLQNFTLTTRVFMGVELLKLESFMESYPQPSRAKSLTAKTIASMVDGLPESGQHPVEGPLVRIAPVGVTAQPLRQAGLGADAIETDIHVCHRFTDHCIVLVP